MTDYHFLKTEPQETAEAIGKEGLLELLEQLLLIRHFELRAESAYQMGKVGGFFHAYMGQEAIQVGAVRALGTKDHWWITTYRCHALALLLGATPAEAMAELYGKASGNAKGRGGSMHLYADRMLGGFGIVGGHLPIATGAAFSLKYQKQKGVAVCFLGDGAFVQGAVHESLNLASLWDLPCIYVIENNKWGMGTGIKRAVCSHPIAERFAPAYGIQGYTLDGMDLLHCYSAFSRFKKEVEETGRPILVEAVTERFRGHSISDPGFYRTKEELEEAKKGDPLPRFVSQLKELGFLSEERYQELYTKQKKQILAAMKEADRAPEPHPTTLEEDVFAP